MFAEYGSPYIKTVSDFCGCSFYGARVIDQAPKSCGIANSFRAFRLVDGTIFVEIDRSFGADLLHFADKIAYAVWKDRFMNYGTKDPETGQY